jgi:Ca-activated chloride channel family protein
LSFADLSLLWLGGALTALALVGVWSHGRRRRKLAEFLGGSRALVRVSRADLSGLRLGRAALLGLAGICLAVAAAGPVWIEPPAREPPPLDALVLAIDVSASMQATDVEPTRLARAIEAARAVVAAAEGQEVGLVVFAGTTYPIAPPTLDHEALGFMLEGISPTMASAYDPGTLVSLAIGESVALLEAWQDSTSGRGRRRVLVISDGDDGENDRAVVAALDSARAAGVEVHAIGVGTERGAGMSLPAGTYQLGGPVTTASGGRAVSRLRESTLRDLANRGGGRYAHVDADADVRAMHAAISAPTTPAQAPGDDVRPAWTRYDLPFVLGLVALALLALESLLDASLPRLPTPRARRVA